LSIELPRDIIDSNPKKTDENYAVFADGQYANADETTQRPK
jgi:hypothetical protein